MHTLRPGHNLRITAADVTTGCYRVDWCKPISQPGYPWGSGSLYLEHRPELTPIQARGLSRPGLYYEAQYLPQVQSALKRPLKTLSSTPLRIERPELPEWATPMDILCADRQWELCQRVWARITSDRRMLTRFIRETIMGAAIDGFYLGEIVCDEVMETFEGFRARYWYPRLPERRAAWTVRYWLTQRERPVGVILDASSATDYAGGTGPSYAVIPWRKLIHVASEQQGSNLEGVSWLRCVYNQIQMLQQSYTLEALATEVNALGELMFILPPDFPAEGPVVDQIKTHLQRRKAGQAPGMVLPHGTQVEVVSPQQTLPDMSGVIGGLTRDILFGLDSADQMIALGDTGAYAAREEATRDQRDGYDYIAQEYVSAPLEDLLRRAIEINYPGDAAQGRVFCPRVEWGVVEERDNETYIQTISIAYNNGLLSEEDIVAARPILRELLDLPDPGARGEAGETLDAVGEDDDPMSGRFVTTSEIARMFGVNTSTIRGWVNRGLVLARRIGGRWRIDVESVRALIDGVDDVDDVQMSEDDSRVPPQGAQGSAERGLRLRREHGRGGTDVGVARARDISNGRALSRETVGRMRSFFARHGAQVDRRDEGWESESDPSAQWIAWLLWGGDAAKRWVESEAIERWLEN